MNIKNKFLLLSVFPILLLGLFIILFISTTLKTSMKTEVKNSLRGTAVAALAAYNQNSGNYFKSSNGDIWKGSYNISKSESIVDDIKNNSDMEVTFFYGKKRIMTSAKDSKGVRLLGSDAGDTIISNVLENGNEYFSEKVSINDKCYYGYYIPVFQSSDNSQPVGMIFVGTEKNSKDTITNKIIFTVIGIILVVSAILAAVSLLSSKSLTNAIKSCMYSIKEVASGNLNAKINEKVLKRNDETSDMLKSVSLLQINLKKIIKNITNNTDILLSSADILDKASSETINTMTNIDSAINSIAEAASTQAFNTQKVSENISDMGNMISDANNDINILYNNSLLIKNNSSNVNLSLKNLTDINNHVNNSIDLISNQTYKTNECSKKIEEAVSLINSIAKETNLISLNASVEAARNGETGRSFSVVASHIQSLAEQSKNSAQEIFNLVSELIKCSDTSVDTMKDVRNIISNQSDLIYDTKKKVNEVIKSIESSVSNINEIESKTRTLNDSRSSIIALTEELSALVEENAASTEETSAASQEVTKNFSNVSSAASKMRDLAHDISNNMKIFKL